MDRITKLYLLPIAAWLILAVPSFAGFVINSSVNWNSPQTISGDSDVSTTGTLVAAFHMNGSTTSVNGVSFAAFAVPSGASSTTNGNYSFVESPGQLLAPTGLGSAQAPFSNLGANYQTLLSTAISTSDNNTLTLNMNGLTSGQTYLFEFWLNASNSAGTGHFRTTAFAGNSVTLDDNVTNTIGGVGQFVIGTFIASSSLEQILFDGASVSEAPTLNAFQLRAIPEPGSVTLLILGGLAVSARYRRSRRS